MIRASSSLPVRISTVLVLLVGLLFGLETEGLSQPTGVRMRATLDPGIVKPGDRSTLIVTVEGLQDAPIPSVKAPPGVVVRALARRALTGGSPGTEFSFGVVAQSEGTYTIGPAELRVGASIYRADPVSLRAARAVSPSAGPGRGTSGEAGGEAGGATSGDVFLRATVDNRTPYVGEQIVYVVRILRSVNIFKTAYEPPNFLDLVVAGQPSQLEYSTLEGGRNLAVQEYRYALFPSRGGTARIGEARFACRIKVGTKAGAQGLFDDDYTGRSEDAVAVAPAIDIHVKPLPSEPQDFSGLVGPTQLSARLAPAELAEKGTSTLTVELLSEGNVMGLAAPKIEGLDAFQTIPDSPKVDLVPREEGKFLAHKTFKTALIASRAGSYEIPPIRVSYFDPVSETYRSAKSDAQRIAVLRPGEKSRSPGAGTGSTGVPAVTVEEMRGIRIVPKRLASEDFRATPGRVWLILSSVPMVGCAVLFVYSRHLRRVRTDIAYARGRRAVRRARSKLAEARALGDGAKADVFFGLVSRTIREYVGDRLNLPGSALTPQEIEAKIREVGVLEGVDADVREFLLSCEYRQLARGESREGERAELLERSEALLGRLERELPK